MAGRVLVTGGSRGVGEIVARHLAATGSTVLIAARTHEAAERAVAGLAPGDHIPLALDVGDPSAWSDARPALDGVTGLVCAAAVLGPTGPLAELDPEDVLATLRVNVMGSLLAAQACEAGLRAAGGGVVLFSGGGATGPLPLFDAYAMSKAAVVRLAENLAAQDLRVNAVAPGFLRTAMQDEVLDAGPARVGAAYHERVRRATAEDGFDDPAAAAELVAFLVSDAARCITGRLLSAVWDPWRDDAFQERLRTEPDLATLRRIDDQFFTTAGRP